MSTHLIIPDPHAHPEYDHERFRLVGECIMEERPDVIVCIGDWADMPSLSSYDKGTRGYEGRRYKNDVRASVEAQEVLFGPYNNWKETRRVRKRRLDYNPRLVMVLGNHEYRIERATQLDPGLEGTIGYEDLGFQAHGWELVPFEESIIIDGVAYSHQFATGVSGRPITGENIARLMIMKLGHSAVQGHSHTFDLAERTRVDGRKYFGLSCGCITHPRYVEDWNRSSHHMAWRGVIVLRGVESGYYKEFKSITLKSLEERYG